MNTIKVFNNGCSSLEELVYFHMNSDQFFDECCCSNSLIGD
jgi:hypothetical protein